MQVRMMKLARSLRNRVKRAARLKRRRMLVVEAGAGQPGA